MISFAKCYTSYLYLPFSRRSKSQCTTVVAVRQGIPVRAKASSYFYLAGYTNVLAL
jgi:hypothetical protein